MASNESFGDELRSEWFVGRAGQIHEELKHDLGRYIRELHQPRVLELLAASGQKDDDVSAVAAANTVSSAEGVLAAVAVYLARGELKTPPPEN
jgi:hypothetical protein